LEIGICGGKKHGNAVVSYIKYVQFAAQSKAAKTAGKNKQTNPGSLTPKIKNS